jgi:hypothetical protein
MQVTNGMATKTILDCLHPIMKVNKGITPMFAPEPQEQQEILQHAVEKAPCITFGQFRSVARYRGWTVEWLREQVADEIEKPTETLRRVMHGALVDGKHQLLAETVVPYRCLIALYQRATQPTPAPAGEKACACGCGARARGQKKWATPGCRKRVQRRSVIAQKLVL